MRERRKAAPDVDLYALAQVRYRDVEADHEKRCEGCPGPHAEDGCQTRHKPRVYLGREWPTCPLGMLSVPAWRSVVTLYESQLLQPLAGWPDAYPAWVVTGIKALAEQRELERRRTAPKAPDGPAWDGRRSAKGGAS